MKMTRRIARLLVQLSAITALSLSLVYFLGRTWRAPPPPLSIHEHIPPPSPPLPQQQQQQPTSLVVVDITIKQCSSLQPFSSCDPESDEWRRIEKDLLLGTAWFSRAFVHVRHKHERELTPEDRVVVDVGVGRLDPTLATQGPDPRWERRPLGLWVMRSPRRGAGAGGGAAGADSKTTITAVDVLFGDDAVEARDGWQITATPMLLGGDRRRGDRLPSPHLTVRRGPPREPKRPRLRIQENGRFRIMQIGDLHLSTGVGVCRDSIPDSYGGGRCEADPRTLDFITRVMDEEKPDLVVLSGDQVNGGTAPDAQTAIFKYAHLLIKRKIPYVTIFGNHDDEGKADLSRAEQMAIVEALPYSLSSAGPADLDGVGNYVVEVFARGGSDHSAITIYLLDTHSYSPDERTYPGYDWLKPAQVEWFRRTAAGLQKKHREFRLHHLDISFIHIPLPEYREEGQHFRGEYREPVTAPFFNSGFRDALVEAGVTMVSCGHDHVNDYCALSIHNETQTPALWMCYAGGSGFGGYAGYGGYHRRVRLFDVDSNVGRITTWKRLEYGDIEARVDEQIIVEAGQPVGPAE